MPPMPMPQAKVEPHVSGHREMLECWSHVSRPFDNGGRVAAAPAAAGNPKI